MMAVHHEHMCMIQVTLVIC